MRSPIRSSAVLSAGVRVVSRAEGRSEVHHTTLISRVVVLVGAVGMVVSGWLPYAQDTPGASPGPDGSGVRSLVAGLGVLIALLATSRLVGYPDLDNRPAGVLGVVGLTSVALLFTLPPDVSPGAGFRVGVFGATAVVVGALLDARRTVDPGQAGDG